MVSASYKVWELCPRYLTPILGVEAGERFVGQHSKTQAFFLYRTLSGTVT